MTRQAIVDVTLLGGDRVDVVLEDERVLGVGPGIAAEVADRVRRTPLPTARTRPWLRVRRVTMRSASPSFWVRRTTPSSR